ncbi:hypothetical protein IWQ60_010887 [Tieghemiomyces parasiticus]|uniref:Uncharacterized protein n=1 Tax=Tieghemiomyces parasiticus TaxID=78921 RepID=A0A9W8DMY8_9FUNG|nr:hypothetical protein IWQ60_010887 [Tieghemiomyces parasiticus]
MTTPPFAYYTNHATSGYYESGSPTYGYPGSDHGSCSDYSSRQSSYGTSSQYSYPPEANRMAYDANAYHGHNAYWQPLDTIREDASE